MGLLNINNKIAAALATGKPRLELYEELAQADPEQSGKYAYCINSIPTAELRKKYLLLNGFLIVSLVGYSILTLISELPIDFNKPTLFIFVKIMVPLVFGYFAFHFHGGLYRLMTLWCAIDLLETIVLIQSGSLTDVYRVALLIICMVVSWVIARNVFPNLALLGPRKNKSGQYLI